VLLEALRSTGLLAALVGLGALELFLPRRVPTQGRGLRWLTNLALGTFNILLTTVALAPVGAAAAAEHFRWGLLHQVSVPGVVAIAIAVVTLDVLSYLQHRVLHATASLWRVHRVHHADVDLDTTTALRFHPIEALIGQVTFGTGIVILGLPPEGVVLYFWLSVVDTIVSHTNIRLPARIERAVQWLFVTPALHAIHHSAVLAESNRNFASIFSVWDRLGGSYLAQPQPVRTGLEEFREPRYLTLPWTLALPFCTASPRERSPAP